MLNDKVRNVKSDFCFVLQDENNKNLKLRHLHFIYFFSALIFVMI
jgi:hypothetical protein